MDRSIYLNAGNSTGRDVTCRKCKEPFEDLYIAEDFTDAEWKRFVKLGPHFDDPDGDEYTCIRGLNGCPGCEEA